MGDRDFHREKILELLEVYRNCPLTFSRGVCLFYVAVHAVDYCLAGMDIQPSTHRGRRKAITNNMDDVVSSAFSELLSASMQVRYTSLADTNTLERMKVSLKTLLLRLEEAYGFPGELVVEITETVQLP